VLQINHQVNTNHHQDMSYSSLPLLKEKSCTKNHGFRGNVAAIICTIVIFLMIIGLIIGFIIGLIILVNSGTPPTKFSIVEASITQFNLINNNTLYYNFKVIITARNFNNQIKYYKNNLNAIFSYKGNTLAWGTIEPFVIGRKNIVTLQPIVLEGDTVMNLNPQQLVEYYTETQLGSYQINLDLFTKVHCPSMKIPIISYGKQTPTFNVTTCSTEGDNDVTYN
jgi:hypothetical protein